MQNLDAGVTITNLYVGETEIAKSGGANWSVSGGKTVVLKKAYLATLDVGDTVFTAKMTDGLTVSFTVTVSDSTPEGNQVTPDSVIFDVNPEGANYKNATLVVTPVTEGATISKLFSVGDHGEEDFEIPETIDDVGLLWSADGDTMTLYAEGFVALNTLLESDPGTSDWYLLLSDDSTAPFTITFEDTQNA